MSDHSETQSPHDGVEMPQPSAAPIVLAAGVLLFFAGFALGTAMSYVGAAVLFAGLAIWIAHLLPGRGHFHEQRVPADQRPQAIAATPGAVEQLQRGMPGYRMRLPLEVHPISAGIKGGVLGGLLMPIPALIWGVLSGHGVWYPINLLAGMVAAGVESMTVAELEQFHLSLLLVGGFIHVVTSVVLGLIYGVLLPTLPAIPKPYAWGALLMPILWTAVSYSMMGIVNPALQHGVSWPWFMVSQFIFGVVLAAGVTSFENMAPTPRGIWAGIVAGVMMAAPAAFWGLASGRGIWYPVNLLAGMLVPGIGNLGVDELRQFNGQWFAIATVIHLVLSVAFGVALSLLVTKLPAIPAPFASGGLLLPLLWTGVSYGLMGVVNPLLQQTVDWPWFIVSQFVFGISVAVVVIRTETIPVRPAGTGPDAAPLTR